MPAVEDDDPACARRPATSVAWPGVVVVISEDGDDRDGEARAGIREDARLLGQAVRRGGRRRAGRDRPPGRWRERARQCSRSASLACTSPAAAMRMVPLIPAGTRSPGSANAPKRYMLAACPRPREPPSLLATMKRAGAVLRENDVDHILGGGLAIWARGVLTDHDVDFLLREEDADRALEVLTDAGFRRAPARALVVQGVGGRASWISSSTRRVARSATSTSRVPPRWRSARTATPRRVDRRRARREAARDQRAGARLPRGARDLRAVREQVNWKSVARRTKSSPFARVLRPGRGPRDRGRQHPGVGIAAGYRDVDTKAGGKPARMRAAGFSEALALEAVVPAAVALAPRP